MTPQTATRVREDDLDQHIKDDRCYAAIRNNILIRGLTWNELTIHEQRAAREAALRIYESSY